MQTPYHEGRVASVDTPEVGPKQNVRLADFNSNSEFNGGPVGPVGPGPTRGPGGDDGGPAVRDVVEPPPPAVHPTPAPTPKVDSGPIRVPSSLISSKTIEKPAPPYPAIARAARVQGTVAVQIVVDEQGRVVSAKATSGNPLLQSAAVQAAYRASFTPTILGGRAVKVTGSITYNFVLR